MHQLYTLTKARTREYYRDKGSLFWSFVATPFMVITLAIAFSSSDRPILTAGVLDYPESVQAPFSDEPTIDLIHYSDKDTAIDRVRHHQLDLLIQYGNPIQYWVNEDSTKGALLEKLLLAQSPERLQHQQVSGEPIRYVDWVIPGILAMNMMFSGLWGIGYVIVRYRKNGVLKRLKATPVSALEFLASQGLSRLAIMLSVTTLVYLGCDLFLDFLMVGSYWLLLLIALLGNLSIISISLLMAARTASEELANGLLNLISFPMLLLSEMWFSLDSAPHWLQAISQALPLTHLVTAARDVMLEGASLQDVSGHLSVLVITTVVFLALAARFFRWSQDD